MSLEPVVIDFISIVVVLYAWMVLPKGKLRWLFILAFLLMAIYKMYEPQADGFVWQRHFAVYAGEIFFYIFIIAFSKRYIEIETSVQEVKQTDRKHKFFLVAPVASTSNGFSWMQFVNNQGLYHILAFPIFVIMVSLVRLRLSIFESKYTGFVRLLTYAIACWTFIHISEFLIESQKLLPWIGDNIGHIEFFWYCAGGILFWFALKKFRSVQNEQKA